MEHMGSAHTQRVPNFSGRDSAAVGHDAPPVLGLCQAVMKRSICHKVRPATLTGKGKMSGGLQLLLNVVDAVATGGAREAKEV